MAVSFTQGNDFIVPTEDGQTYLGGAGNDTYMLSSATVAAGATIVIQDTEGTNQIQLVDGLEIASSTVYNDALELVLSNGAVIQIVGASSFGYDVGGNALIGTEGTQQTFTELVEDTLGTTVPAEGEDPTTGGEVIISDEEAAPTLSISDTSVTEGDPGDTVQLTFTVTLSEAQESDVTFDFNTTTNGTADVVDDFVATAISPVTIAAGETSVEITVDVTPDNLEEADETVEAVISNPSAGVEIADGTAIGTIVDDDEQSFTLSQGADDVQEGDTITYTLTASEPVTEDTVVSFTVVPGDATAADQGTNDTNLDDFSQGAFNPYEVTMAAGETTVTFSLDTVNDGITELPEDFSVEASIDGEVVDTITTTLLDGPQGGETFTLTDGVDSGNDFVGTAGDDTYVGTDTTFTTGDDLDGSDGEDTLSLIFSDDTVTPVVDFANIENVTIRNADGTGGLVLDATGWTGMDLLTHDRATAATADVTINNLMALPTLSVVQGAATDFIVNVDPASVDLTGTDDAASIDLNKANLAILGIGDGAGESIEEFNITNVGDSTILSLENASGAQINPSSLMVTGSGSLDLHDDGVTNTQYTGMTSVSSTGVALILDIDNSGSTAGTDTSFMSTGDDDDLTLVAADGTAANAAQTTVSLGDGDNTLDLTDGASVQTISVTTGAGEDDITLDVTNATVDTSTASVTTGGGDDTVDLTNNAGNNVAVTMDLGAGDDVLTLDTINATADVTDSYDGGDDTDTIRGLSANLATIEGDADQLATINNFEILAVTNLLANNIDLTLWGLNTISLETNHALAGDRTITVANNSTISLNQDGVTGDIDTTSAYIIAVDGASGAGSSDDVVNFEINADFDGLGPDTFTADISVDYVETLNIMTTDSLVDGDDTLNGGENFVVNVEDGDRLDTINVDAELATNVLESGGINFVALNIFNAGASTGGVTVDVTNATQGVVMTGGEGDDNFTGSIYNDQISTGDGDDTIDAGTGADELTGGEGYDDFVFVSGDSDEAEMDVITDYQQFDGDDADTLTLDSSNDTVGTADPDAVLSVGADIASGAAIDVSGADADATATDIEATVTDGIISLSGDDASAIDTLAEWIDAAELVQASYEAAVGTEATDVAEYVNAFEFNGNTYVISAVDGNGAADIATDDVIQLTGVTGGVLDLAANQVEGSIVIG